MAPLGRAVGEGVAGGAIAPPVFRGFRLFSWKSTLKMLKIGLFCVFRPPVFASPPQFLTSSNGPDVKPTVVKQTFVHISH